MVRGVGSRGRLAGKPALGGAFAEGLLRQPAGSVLVQRIPVLTCSLTRTIPRGAGREDA
jgi:hypothetical protein